jgi:hypothetical protein
MNRHTRLPERFRSNVKHQQKNTKPGLTITTISVHLHFGQFDILTQTLRVPIEISIQTLPGLDYIIIFDITSIQYQNKMVLYLVV